MTDYNLQRFLDAQNSVLDTVSQELVRGKKRTHWMWYVFPQIQGLGSSSSAQYYAIQSLNEAQAYHDHEVLGERLRSWTAMANQHDGVSSDELFGPVDGMKFRSSMTLFSMVECASPVFREALDVFFSGEPDARTLEILGK